MTPSCCYTIVTPLSSPQLSREKKAEIENKNFFVLEDSVAILSELKLSGML